MKKIITFLMLLTGLHVSAQSTSNNVVHGTVGDYGLAPQPGVAVTVTRISPPLVINNIEMRNDPMGATSDNSGNFSYTNLNWGRYRFDIAGAGTSYYFTVATNTAGTVAIQSLIGNNPVPPDPSTGFYTRSQVDGLLGGYASLGNNNIFSGNNTLGNVTINNGGILGFSSRSGGIQIGDIVSSFVLNGNGSGQLVLSDRLSGANYISINGDGYGSPALSFPFLANNGVWIPQVDNLGFFGLAKASSTNLTDGTLLLHTNGNGGSLTNLNAGALGKNFVLSGSLYTNGNIDIGQPCCEVAVDTSLTYVIVSTNPNDQGGIDSTVNNFYDLDQIFQPDTPTIFFAGAATGPVTSKLYQVPLNFAASHIDAQSLSLASALSAIYGGTGFSSLNSMFNSRSNYTMQFLQLDNTNMVWHGRSITATSGSHTWTAASGSFTEAQGFSGNNNGVATGIGMYLITTNAGTTYQLHISKVVNDTTLLTFEAAPLSLTFQNFETFIPTSVNTDNNGNAQGWVAQDGTLGVNGLAQGGTDNSGGIEFWNGTNSLIWSTYFDSVNNWLGLHSYNIGDFANSIVRIHPQSPKDAQILDKNGVNTFTWGIASLATNTYSMTTGGYTNTSAKAQRIFGFGGTSVRFSNSVSTVNFSIGTIGSPGQMIVVEPNESVTGTSCSASKVVDF